MYNKYIYIYIYTHTYIYIYIYYMYIHYIHSLKGQQKKKQNMYVASEKMWTCVKHINKSGFLLSMCPQGPFLFSPESDFIIVVEHKKLGCLIRLAKCFEKGLYFDTFGEQGLQHRFLLCLGAIWNSSLDPADPKETVSSSDNCSSEPYTRRGPG